MIMQVLVTGGAGFIGGHIVDLLINKGHQVTIIDDLSTGKTEWINKEAGFIQDTICNPKLNLSKFDSICHLAALPRVQFSIDHPEESHNANVNGVFNMLNLARKYKVRRFVFSSSSSVYGDQEILPLKEEMIPNPMSPYALHKLIAEQYCRLFLKIYGVETISLRYFNVYGPRHIAESSYANLIPKFTKLVLKNEQPTINGDGEQTRDFTSVHDVAKANLSALTTQNKETFGETFNIGSGKNISINEVSSLIIKNLKSKIKPRYGPKLLEPKNTLADISKASELLNYNPSVVFREGIKEFIAWYKDYNNIT